MTTPLGPSGAQTYADHVAVCLAKRSYLSRTLAANAAWILNLLPNRRNPVEPYRCHVCKDFHLRSIRGH